MWEPDLGGAVAQLLNPIFLALPVRITTAIANSAAAASNRQVATGRLAALASKQRCLSISLFHQSATILSVVALGRGGLDVAAGTVAALGRRQRVVFLPTGRWQPASSRKTHMALAHCQRLLPLHDR